jgi:hypothetical protein
MAVNFIQPSYAAGELAPALSARVDLDKYHQGAKLLRNFFVWPQGGISNRAGTMFVGRCKGSTKPICLIPFQFNLVQAYILEFGDQYMRVIMDGGYVLEPTIGIYSVTNGYPGIITTSAPHGYSNGDQVFIAGTNTGLDSTAGRTYLVTNATATTFSLTDLDGNPINITSGGVYAGGGIVPFIQVIQPITGGETVARIFTLATPYDGNDVADIKWAQSNDVLTLCHPSYPPQDLSRTEHWVWSMDEVSFAAKISPPTGLSVSHNAGTNSPTGQQFYYSYVVTALSLASPEQSLPSAAASVQACLLDYNTGSENVISWTAETAADLYYVYKANPQTDPTPSGAMYGYIGHTTGTKFTDAQIAPDFSHAPPTHTDPFNAGPIATVSISNGGSGYSAAISLYANDLSGSGAVLTPTVSNAVPATYSVSGAGTGYVTANALPTTGGTGAGATVNITVSGGSITAGAVNPNAPGSGYAVNDVLSIVQTGGAGGTLTVTAVANGVITAVAITNGGQNYLTPVIGVANAGQGAVGHINVQTVGSPPIQITTITATLISGGQNYFGTVTITAASGGSGCTFKPTIINGVITKIKVTGAPHGYIDGDSLVFTQSGGAGASFTSSIDPSGNYPSCCCYFQQRKCFAGSLNSPQTIWMTQVADYSNMDISNPTLDSDAITLTIAAQQVNAIKHLVPMNDLLIFTSGGIWRILTGMITQPQPVTPTNTVVIPQTWIGAADLPPLVVNYDILYVQAKGSIVRDLAYNFWMNVYTGTDMSVLAQHLFFGHNMERWAYAEQPWYQIWTVRDDGVLLSFTYLKEQNVYAWAHHDSPGDSGTDRFLSVASIPEQQVAGVNADSVYFVVERTIPGINGGQPVKYVERMDSRNMGTLGASDVSRAWFLDAALQYSGAPTTTFVGLDHLNGATVSILADGSVMPPQVVVNGVINLPVAASVITVGLPYVAQMQSLPMMPQGMAMQAIDYRKTLKAISLNVQDTRGLKVGPNFQMLTEIKERGPAAPMGQPIPLTTGTQRLIVYQQYTVNDCVCVQADQPLPCTILGISPEMSLGDGPG